VLEAENPGCAAHIKHKSKMGSQITNGNNILLTFIFQFTIRLPWTKIFELSNLSNLQFTIEIRKSRESIQAASGPQVKKGQDGAKLE